MVFLDDPADWRRRRRLLQAFLRAHHSVISTGELGLLGFVGPAVTRLVVEEVIVRESRGVYRAGGATPGELGQLRCTLLSAGDGAALARRSAGFFLGYLAYPPPLVHVVVPRRASRSRIPGGYRHGAPGLQSSEVFVDRGTRCTTPLRTILDLAAEATDEPSRRVLRRVLRGASNDDHSLPGKLREIVAAGPFAGSVVLAAELGGDLSKTLVVRSAEEDKFVELCKRHGLPVPQTNAVVHGFELDNWWEDERVYVEVDTFGTHGSEVSFEADRQRDRILAALGIHGFRVTDHAIADAELLVARQVAGLLGLA